MVDCKISSISDPTDNRDVCKMNESEKPRKEISRFRTILPQVLASTAKNLLLLDLGMAVSFPTIVIPALKGLKAHDNMDFLSFTDSQASWFGEKTN